MSRQEMSRPIPLLLAHTIASHLADLDWAIGGSTLLHHLGVEPAPVDLDIVISIDHFKTAESKLMALFGEALQPQHASYQSAHFSRFTATDGTQIDIMAGIAVLQGNELISWTFEPQNTVVEDGLPWMRAEDWLALYDLFNRPARVDQVQKYLTSQR
jgi:hypothetical protein